MSRVGKNPINVPDGVDVKIQNSNITVKGPKGELKWDYPYGVKIDMKDKTIVVERGSNEKSARSMHGTARSLISNMITGTTAGFQKVLEISGVGYRAQVQGKKIILTLGFSHPVDFELPDGVTAEVDKKQTNLTLSSIDKQLLGQVAANIRALRPPNVYKGKGIRYAGEHVKLKVGKAGK